jgi:two-component system nitrogen regulation response regulator GlnG
MNGHILILEDDENLKRVLARSLVAAGYQVRSTASIETVFGWLKQGDGDLLLADVLLDGSNFLERLALVHRLRPRLPVIVMSAQTTAAMAIEAEKVGVFEYLPKPFDLDLLSTTVAAAIAGQATPRPRLSDDARFGFVGKSAIIQATFKAIARAANSRAHTVIIGEAGTGKKQIAEAVLSARGISGQDVVTLTSSHSVEDVFNSVRQGGHVICLRLDDWEPPQERALLNAMDLSAARIIATSSVALGGQVDARLASKIGECQIDVPPLRDRQDDIADLCAVFLSQFAHARQDGLTTLSSSALARLERERWPGNVGELRAVLSRLSLAVRGKTATVKNVEQALPVSAIETSSTLDAKADILAAESLLQNKARSVAIDALDNALIAQAMRQADGNRSKAAELLGLNRNTLSRRLKELKIDC